MLPLFPLPNVVLFPNVPLPLHIFEPRYRAMVADALDGDRRLVMVLLRDGWQSGYEGRPPIYQVGCAGEIVHASKREDGRYDIVLRGHERVRIVEEDHERPYRRAATVPLPDARLDVEGRQALAELRLRIGEMLGLPSALADESAAYAERLDAMPDEDFVHVIAHGLEFEPIEKQALLECPDLRGRAQALADLLEMQRIGEPGSGAPPKMQ